MGHAHPGVFQLGTGVGTSLNDLVSLLKTIAPGNVKFEVHYKDFRDGEIKHTWCDISRAKASLGYAPQIGLREGLQKTWDWFQTQ